MLKALPIKKIFIRKMIVSTIMQFFILAILFILIQSYVISNEKENLIQTLTINDSFSQEELTKYKILENDYAFDLSLRGIADERKLDAIWFSDSLKPLLGKCSFVSNTQYMLCDGKNGIYYGVTPLSINHKIIGYVVASKKYGFLLAPVYYGLIIILIIVMGAFLFNFLFLFISIKNSFEKNTNTLLNFISNKGNDMSCIGIDIQEYSQVAQRFIEKRNEIRILEKEKCYNAAMKNLAVQVAHDIRSPLLVLKTILSDILSMPEQQRIDARSAIQRVTDIANNLLTHYRQDVHELNNVALTKSAEPMAIMLEGIVSEKRIQVSGGDIEINLQFPSTIYDAFVCVDTIGFKRVLSNLLNNAVEAFNGAAGIITIILNRSNGKIVIDVKDNGCGISEEKLYALLNKGGTFDKKEGSGLGLPYAMNKVMEWGGEYSFTSKLGVGTQFEMILPEAKPADWFQSHIDIMKGSTIIVLDDDEYVHRIWEERLSERFLSMNNLQLLHYTHPNALIKFLNSNNNTENMIYFIDYELGHDCMTGLEVVQKLNIGDRATLVTSRYEDADIRIKCKELGMRIIPKFFTELVPINIYQSTDFVFIDNEKIMTRIWKESAEGAGKSISVFNDSDDFMRILHHYSKQTTIYIDSSLDHSVKGEEIAKILYEKGYFNLILATGYPKSRFAHVVWVKDIIGKEPPWGDPPRSLHL